jgi:hypothetical protein
MELNLDKVIIFHNRGRGRYELFDKLDLEGVKIKFVTGFTNLGVVF